MEIEIDDYSFLESIDLIMKDGIYDDITYSNEVRSLFYFKGVYYYKLWGNFITEDTKDLLFIRIDKDTYSVKHKFNIYGVANNWKFISPVSREVILDFNSKAKPKYRLIW